MSKRKAFLLRIDPAILSALQAWADDEMRSLNGQIEFLLRSAAVKAGRLRGSGRPAADDEPVHPGAGGSEGGEA